MTDPYDPYRQHDPDGQPGQPYVQRQYGPYQPGGPYQGGSYPGQPPYQGGPYPDATRQFNPYNPYHSGQPYQGSYGQPAGWGPGTPKPPAGSGGPGGFPPRPGKKPRAAMIALAVLGAFVLLAGVLVAAVLVGDGGRVAAGPPATTATETAIAEPTTPDSSGSTSPETSEPHPMPGQCATLTPKPDNKATIQVATCGTIVSDVVIAKTQTTECEQPFLSFNVPQGTVYCLGIDAKERDCFKLDQYIKRVITCGPGTHRVLKVFEGEADAGKCRSVPGTTESRVYPDPKSTVCLGKIE